MSRPRVAIAHDYLTQRGGAERVVLTLMKAFPEAAVHTTLYDPEGTYPEFRDADVRTSPLNRIGALRRDHRLALPLLAPAASRMEVDADIVVASSSGWAHGFETSGRTVVYCHNPARWLYQTDEYLGGTAWRSPIGPPLLALRPMLKRWDRRRAEQVDVYLANSRVVQKRIRATYGREAELLPPPHGMDAAAPREPVPELEDWDPGYALVVSRLLPYKNVDAVIEAVRGTERRLVVVGRGPEEARLRATLPDNVRLLGGLSDAQLRAVYAGAGVIVAASHEDFGLAPLEAAAFGVPAVALRGGGFLETVLEGETGIFFDRPEPDEIATGLEISDKQDWDADRLVARAEEFGEARFIDRIRTIAFDEGAGAEVRPEGIRLLPWLIGAVDLVMVAIGTVLAIQFRLSLSVFATSTDVLENTAVASVFFGGTWLVMLAFFGTYERHVFGAGTEEFKLVVNASFFTGALVATMAYLLQYPLSRGFFVLYFPIGVLLLLIGRLFSRRMIQRFRRAGHFNEKVLLVGTPGYIGEIHTVLARESWLGYDVIGCLVPRDYAGLDHTSAGIPVLGLIEEVRAVVDEHNADIVFFTAGAVSSSTELRRLAWDLEDHQHVQIIVAPNVTDVSSERVRIRPVAGLPLMHLGRSRSQLATNDAKRAFDLVGAIFILALVWPILLGLMLWVRRHDGGPALFRQTRVGREGAEFTCLKLRSMSVDAEERLTEMEARDHVLFKSTEDPRVTRPGKLIRRFSLDELPQLWNVVRGEMSLVGPRPPLASEVEQYEDDMLRRLNVLPGMTGLWQVSGRSDLSWEDTVRLDLYYVDNWSMVQDLLILARTVTAVLASRGAY